MLDKNIPPFSCNLLEVNPPATSENCNGIVRISKGGKIRNGKLFGFGVLIHPNKMVETGLFVDDIIQKGNIIMANGDKISGFFDNNSIPKKIQIKRGIIQYANGICIKGWEFKDNSLVTGVTTAPKTQKIYTLNGINISKDQWKKFKESNSVIFS